MSGGCPDETSLASVRQLFYVPEESSSDRDRARRAESVVSGAGAGFLSRPGLRAAGKFSPAPSVGAPTASGNRGLEGGRGSGTRLASLLPQAGTMLKLFCWVCFRRRLFVLPAETTLAVCSRCGNPEGAMRQLNPTERLLQGLKK